MRNGLDRLMGRIGERVLEQDQLLRTVWVTRSSEEASRRLFDRYADVCLEQLFLDLEFRHTVGELGDDEYVLETARLITQCRVVGLTPPVAITELDLDADDDTADTADTLDTTDPGDTGDTADAARFEGREGREGQQGGWTVGRSELPPFD